MRKVIEARARPLPVDERQPPPKPWNDKIHKNIRQILISHGDSINSIQAAYCNGRRITLSEQHGGDGDKFDIIDVDASDRLIEIKGYYGHHLGNDEEPVVIRSLRFVTRFGKYGPFGREEGTPFSFKLDPGAFAGFHGESSNKFLHSIGIHVKTLAAEGDGACEETGCKCM